MNCPYCNKHIPAMTGLQELQKFQKHLRTCKKNPARETRVYDDGSVKTTVSNSGLLDALKIRSESGQ